MHPWDYFAVPAAAFCMEKTQVYEIFFNSYWNHTVILMLVFNPQIIFSLENVMICSTNPRFQTEISILILIVFLFFCFSQGI